MMKSSMDLIHKPNDSSLILKKIQPLLSNKLTKAVIAKKVVLFHLSYSVKLQFTLKYFQDMKLDKYTDYTRLTR
jgi:hypothetical protein